MEFYLKSDGDDRIVNSFAHALQLTRHDPSYNRIAFKLPEGRVIVLVKKTYLPSIGIEWVLAE